MAVAWERVPVTQDVDIQESDSRSLVADIINSDHGQEPVLTLITGVLTNNASQHDLARDRVLAGNKSTSKVLEEIKKIENLLRI